MTTGRGYRGFTLIEAIVSIVILSVAVPGMFWAIRDASVKRVDPVQASRARWLAGERLEDVIADRHSPSRGYAWVVNANYPDEAAVTGYAGFGRSVSVVETGPSLTGAGSGYKTVTVTVTYQSAGGDNKSFPLASVVTEYTP